jgi:hypothetical protein
MNKNTKPESRPLKEGFTKGNVKPNTGSSRQATPPPPPKKNK